MNSGHASFQCFVKKTTTDVTGHKTHSMVSVLPIFRFEMLLVLIIGERQVEMSKLLFLTLTSHITHSLV